MNKLKLNRFIAITFGAGALIGCNSEVSKDTEATVRHCMLVQEQDPEQMLGGKAECECAATKIANILTPDHYSVFVEYKTKSADIALALPDLHGSETDARTLKAVSVARDETPTEIFAAMREFTYVTSIAYQLCGLSPQPFGGSSEQ